MYNRYYYQYDIKRIQVCTLPIHALLHVPHDIRATGPVSICWSWVIERFCGLLGTESRKKKQYMNANLANQMHSRALVNYFEARYDLGLFQARRKKGYLGENEEDQGYILGSKSTQSNHDLTMID
jgi:hypothetical protein